MKEYTKKTYNCPDVIGYILQCYQEVSNLEITHYSNTNGFFRIKDNSNLYQIECFIGGYKANIIDDTTSTKFIKGKDRICTDLDEMLTKFMKDHSLTVIGY